MFGTRNSVGRLAQTGHRAVQASGSQNRMAAGLRMYLVTAEIERGQVLKCGHALRSEAWPLVWECKFAESPLRYKAFLFYAINLSTP